MPQRQNTKRHLCDEVQGSDSWIDIISPKQGEMKDFQKQLEPLNERLEQLKTKGLDDNNPEMREAKQKLNSVSEKLFQKFIKAWNWVNDDGEALPQPSTEGVFDLLTIQEIRFITKLFNFGTEEKKA